MNQYAIVRPPVPPGNSGRDGRGEGGQHPSRRLTFLALISLSTVAGCGQSTAPPPQAPPIDRAVWRKLSPGMNPDQVKATLGEPKSVESQADVVCWYYLAGQPLERHAVEANQWMIPRGSVLFSTKAGNTRLIDWRDP